MAHGNGIVHKRIVVIGASAGGVEALTAVVRCFPADMEVPVLVTHHQAPQSQSMMPAILSRAGALPARHALNNLPLEGGKIYVAPPDKHMLVKGNRIRLGTGPRENCTRPAIDPLFRTAATEFGAGVIAVILSGNLDDGTEGLAVVKECGGLGIVQDPAEAPYPGMPQSAIDNVEVDFIVPLAEIGGLIMNLIRQPDSESAIIMCPSRDDESSLNPDPAEGIKASMEAKKLGVPSVYTCPDCHGTLWEMEKPAGVLRFRCRVGHAYSSKSLAAQQGDKVEEALWTALRALEERSGLVERLAKRARAQNQAGTAKRFEKQKLELDSQATLIRQIVEQGQNDAVTSEDEEHG